MRNAFFSTKSLVSKLYFAKLHILKQYMLQVFPILRGFIISILKFRLKCQILLFDVLAMIQTLDEQKRTTHVNCMSDQKAKISQSNVAV